jgi:D-3-phosphoglycerate dehydrogenase
MSFTVLMTAPTLAPAGQAILDEAGCQTLFAATNSDFREAMAGAPVDAIISRILPVTAELMDLSPQLRVISRHGVGYNNVDIAAATARGIPVLITPASNGQSVVELTIGLMIAVARDVVGYDATVKDGGWVRVAKGMQLSGTVLGLVGLGGIGRGVAKVALALGMRVIAFDPAAIAGAENVQMVATLDELLASSDVVSLHCPLTAENHHLIGAAEMSRMRRGAILINTARGGLVDEDALAAALAAGHLAGAGLDSLKDEPPKPGNPLLGLQNIILTPHIGGSTGAAIAATAAGAVNNALNILRNMPVTAGICVNPLALNRKQIA